MGEDLPGVEAAGVRPVVELLLLAGPTVAQMASYTVMQFLDIWLLSRVGDAEAAAAASSAGFLWSLISFGTGVLFLVNTLGSQCFGRGDNAGCGRYLWQGVWWSAAYSALLMLAYPGAGRLFLSLGHPGAFAAMEGTYFRTLLLCAGFRLTAVAHGQFLIATNRPRMVTVAAAAGVGVNALVAYAWILGRWGSSRHGVVGAAWANNVGAFTEMAVLAAAAWWGGGRRRFHMRDWRFRVAEMRVLLRLGIPAGVQNVAEVLGWSVFAGVVVARFGTEAMAAFQYMLRYLITGFLPAVGIGTAVTALVGRYIGRGRVDLAAKRAHLGFAMAGIYTVLCGVTFFTFRRGLIGLFTEDPGVLSMGMTLMAVTAFYSFFDAMYVVYSGALRGAGDTFVPALTLAGLCWGVMLGGGMAVAVAWPGWGVSGPWGVTMVYGIILGFFMLARFQRGAWKRLHLESGGGGDTLRGSVQPVPEIM